MPNYKAEYQRRAHEADDWARDAPDAKIREKFKVTARHWHDLAARTASGGLQMDVDLPLTKPDETQH